MTKAEKKATYRNMVISTADELTTAANQLLASATDAMKKDKAFKKALSVYNSLFDDDEMPLDKEMCKHINASTKACEKVKVKIGF